MTITVYAEFLERVNELGFLVLSDGLPGLPSLSNETISSHWHTGDPETDPWQWKDRAAAEKQAAYGCILGGHKGFVTPHWYATFYAAYHPQKMLAERWADGEVKQSLWQLWQLFLTSPALDTSQVRKEMQVSGKSGASRVDADLKELQRTYHLTVAGCRRKLAKDGSPYGWPSSIYARVSDWIPAEWLKPAPALTPLAARQAILEQALKQGPAVPPEEILRFLGLDEI